MPIGVECEAAAATALRPTARLDTAASRRLIDNALGVRTANSGSNSTDKGTIMSTPRNRSSKSKGKKSSTPAVSSGRNSKAAKSREEHHEVVDQQMAIDEEGISNDDAPSPNASTRSGSTSAQIDESIDHLNSVLRRYIPVTASETANEDESDNSDAEDAWQNPIKAFGDIQEARDRMMDACNKHDEYMRSHKKRGSEEQEEDDDTNDEEFRALYMSTMTTAFAAELDDIRTGRAAAKASGKKSCKRKKVGGAKGTNASTIMDADNMFVDPDHMKEDAAEEEEEPLVQENIDVEVLVDILQGGMRSFTAKERKMLIEESKRRKDGGEGNEEGDIVTPHARRRKMLGF